MRKTRPVGTSPREALNACQLQTSILSDAAGRDERLNQKTVNKRVIVMLQTKRSAGADIALRKGDWPKTVENQVEIYGPDELKRFFAECDQAERLLF